MISAMVAPRKRALGASSQASDFGNRHDAELRPEPGAPEDNLQKACFAVQDYILDFETGVDKLDLSSLNFQVADLLTLNETINGTNFTDVGIDANHNGNYYEGE